MNNLLGRTPRTLRFVNPPAASIKRFTDPFFFNDTAATEIYTLSLHDALPIFGAGRGDGACVVGVAGVEGAEVVGACRVECYGRGGNPNDADAHRHAADSAATRRAVGARVAAGQ